jgi:replicative DNA helicase
METKNAAALEQAVIGACLVPGLWLAAREEVGSLVPSLGPVHQELLGAVERVVGAGGQPSILLVESELGARAAALGGAAYLAQCQALAREAGISPHLPAEKLVERLGYLTAKLQSRALRQSVAGLGRDAIELSQLTDIADDEVLTRLQNQLVAIWPTKSGQTLWSPEGSYDSLLAHIEAAQRGETSIPTGFAPLDAAIGGVMRGELVVIGGTSSFGKSSVAVFLCDLLAQAGLSVLYFSPEMSEVEIQARRVAGRLGIPYSSILKGQLTGEQHRAVVRARSLMARDAFWIEHDKRLSPEDVRMRTLRRAAELGGVDVVVVDYLQKLRYRSTSHRDQRYRQVGEAASDFKDLAVEINGVCLALSQVTFDKGARRDAPTEHDLRESGDIKQHADTILLLDWLHKRNAIKNFDAMFPSQQQAARMEMNWIIAKQRNGEQATIELDWLAAYGLYVPRGEGMDRLSQIQGRTAAPRVA